MSQSTAQVVVAAAVCLGFIFAVYRLARNGLLSFYYTVGWLSLFAVGIVALVALPLTNALSRVFEISPVALLFSAGTLVLLMICIQLSISISGLQNQVRRLSEELAKLRLHVELRDSDNADK